MYRYPKRAGLLERHVDEVTPLRKLRNQTEKHLELSQETKRLIDEIVDSKPDRFSFDDPSRVKQLNRFLEVMTFLNKRLQETNQEIKDSGL